MNRVRILFDEYLLFALDRNFGSGSRCKAGTVIENKTEQEKYTTFVMLLFYNKREAQK